MLRVWLKISQAPTPPSRITLAIDFASSIRPCRPNMRFMPASGLSLLPLKAKAWGRKPSEPSIAGAPTAATRVSANRTSTGRATAPSRRRIDARRIEIADVGRAEAKPVGQHRLHRADDHRPHERDPGRADEDDEGGAEFARLKDVAIFRRLPPALGRRCFCLLVRDPASPDMAQPPERDAGAPRRGRARIAAVDAFAEHRRGDGEQDDAGEQGGGEADREQVELRRRAGEQAHHDLDEDDREGDRQGDREAGGEEHRAEEDEAAEASAASQASPGGSA